LYILGKFNIFESVTYVTLTFNTNILTFEDFNFAPTLFEGLNSMGYKAPTPIQAQTIPILQEGHDLIGCAQTGTGKTAAYLLPVMDAICKKADRATISALILAPTRELAVQIDQQAEGLGYFAGISSMAVYGGGDGMGYEQQKRALREGVDLVIATPGRLIAHLNSGLVKFEQLQFLILDEADRMLDMGFKDDINKIVRQLPEVRQTILFSATMPAKIASFAKSLLKQPRQVNIALSKPAEGIAQQQYRTFDEQKSPLLLELLKPGAYSRIIIFCSTKDKVKQLDREMRKSGLMAEPFHSDLDQEVREKILLRFRNNQLPILIGTDVLSRGIDVEGIDLVINYDVPPDPEDYIHRIGRTARAERKGTAITFVNNRDYQRFKSIEQLMEREVERISLPESLGEGPVWTERPKNKSGNNFTKRKNGDGKSRQSNFRGKKKTSGQSPKEVKNSQNPL
jgi:ATP-dependent RNA helicase RhlE